MRFLHQKIKRQSRKASSRDLVFRDTAPNAVPIFQDEFLGENALPSRSVNRFPEQNQRNFRRDAVRGGRAASNRR